MLQLHRRATKSATRPPLAAVAQKDGEGVRSANQRPPSRSSSSLTNEESQSKQYLQSFCAEDVIAACGGLGHSLPGTPGYCRCPAHHYTPHKPRSALWEGGGEYKQQPPADTLDRVTKYNTNVCPEYVRITITSRIY
ncbi:hypothetical protein E2C01_014336 [Portunus trituberculatus]|uniref:Uncharacterized protein n=1 Tax=Portunus trituberculatus TaxID=210409 RepID=A0A5B7DJP9_PORTR|nr:hypothetical protein [Portunus trituberculatus]